MRLERNIVILACLGAVLLLFNKPLGEGLRRSRKELSGEDLGAWSYRTPLILIGLLLVGLGITDVFVD